MSDGETEKMMFDLTAKIKEITGGKPRVVILGALAVVKAEILQSVSEDAMLNELLAYSEG